jgi:hypothetical protein
MASDRMGDLMDNIGRTVDGKAIPLFHGRTVDGFFIMLFPLHKIESIKICFAQNTYRKCHPRDWFRLRNVGLLDQVQSEGLIVKGDCINATWRSPGTDHEMVLHVGRD